MGAFAAALATMLAGQEQGRQATALYRQQLESRQLDEQIKRALLLGQLQAMQQQQAALAQLPAKDQQGFQLGEKYPDYAKRQADQERVKQWKSALAAAILDQSRSIDERKKLLSEYGGISPESDAGDIEKQLKTLYGFGSEAKPSDFERYYQTFPPGSDMLTAHARWMSAGKPEPGSVAQLQDKDGKVIGFYNTKTGAFIPPPANMPEAYKSRAAGTKASPAEAMAARELGLPSDPSSWTPTQALAIEAKANANAAARATATTTARTDITARSNAIINEAQILHKGASVEDVLAHPAWIAEARTRLEQAKTATEVERRTAIAKAIAAIGKPPKEWTATDRLRIKTLALNEALKELQSRFSFIKPNSAAARQRAAEILRLQGLDAEAYPLPVGTKMTVP